MDLAWDMWERLQEDESLSPAIGTYNAMVNCLSKNAAVGAVTMAEGRELMLAAFAHKQKTSDSDMPGWDEQTVVSYLELLQRLAASARGKGAGGPEDAAGHEARLALEEGWWAVAKAEEGRVVLGPSAYNALMSLVAKVCVCVCVCVCTSALTRRWRRRWPRWRRRGQHRAPTLTRWWRGCWSEGSRRMPARM